MTQTFDATVIGAGQSVSSLDDRMDEEGMKVAVIECKLFSGTCVNVGCVPTKTLVASTRSLGLPVTYDDFTRLVASSRKIVGKVMGPFRDRGLIRSSCKKIDFLDMGAPTKISESG